MNAPAPHFLLFSESNRKHPQGQWRFVLQSLDGSKQLEAEDVEPDMQGERLELLAVVRGLEALPEPSRVTLVTPSKYVNRGLSNGLSEWRQNGWEWEHFGQMVPVKNRDLWQRIDHALQFHDLECRAWRFDLPHVATAAASSVVPRAHLDRSDLQPVRQNKRIARLRIAFSEWREEKAERIRLWLGQLGTRLVPLPWLE